MPGPEFFQTPMGRRFYESTMPDIATALLRIAGVLEKPPKPAESRFRTTPEAFGVDWFRRTTDLLSQLADAEHGACYCRVHAGDCPGGDCDGCPNCPTGRARSILVELGLDS